MSIEDTKRSKRAAAQHLAEAEATAKAKAAPRQRPVVGAYAQVSLLPREMLLKGRSRVVRRRLIAGVIVTAVVVAGGVVGSAVLAVGAGADLAQQTQQSNLLTQQARKYQAVQDVQSRLTLDKSAARVGSSTAINWDPQIDRITAGMPAGWAVTAITTDSATPIQDYQQGTTPLDQPRAATVTVTARTTSLADLPQWINRALALPETADATPTVSTAGAGKYTVVLTVHLTTKAYITPLKTGASQ